MHQHRSPLSSLLVGLIATAPALAATGCGLISSNVTNFDLTLPDKTFSVDTSSWNLMPAVVPGFLSTSCAASPNVCASAAATVCKTGTCAGSCDATTKTCDLSLDVSLYRPVDLITEKPELKTINDQPLITVTIDSVQYEVPTNSMNVATPEMTVYVAPMSVMSPTDPMAKPIGTIASVPAGMVLPRTDMVFTATGKAELVTVMNNFKTPFNVIVGSTLSLHDGSTLPSGKLDAIVHITAHAGI
jgi:hypothetical protein